MGKDAAILILSKLLKSNTDAITGAEAEALHELLTWVSFIEEKIDRAQRILEEIKK